MKEYVNELNKLIQNNYTNNNSFCEISPNTTLHIASEGSIHSAKLNSIHTKIYNSLITENTIHSLIVFGEEKTNKSKIIKDSLLFFINHTNQNKKEEKFRKNLHYNNKPEIGTLIIQSYEIIKTFTENINNNSKANTLIHLHFDPHGEITQCKFSINTLLPLQMGNIYKVFHSFISELNKGNFRFPKSNNNIDYYSEHNLKNDHFSLWIRKGDKTILPYKDLIYYLRNLQFIQSDIDEIIMLVLVILHLLTLQIIFNDSNKGTINHSGQQDIRIICSIIDSKDINEKILSEFLLSNPSSKDVLVKVLYYKLLDFIIKKINKTLSPLVPQTHRNTVAKSANFSLGNKFSNCIINSMSNKRELYLFDSIGYSSSMLNDYCELIANYSIEKIFYFFTKAVLLNKTDEYDRENISYVKIPFLNNAEILKLFEQKGIFDIIEKHKHKEQADKLIYREIYEKLSSNISLGVKGDNFITINHSFGDFSYFIEGISENDLKELPSQEMFSSKLSGSSSINKILKSTKTSNYEFHLSLCKSTKKQLDELLTVLSRTNLHFIRTVKYEQSYENLINKLSIMNLYELYYFNDIKYEHSIPLISFIKCCSLLSNKTKSIYEESFLKMMKPENINQQKGDSTLKIKTRKCANEMLSTLKTCKIIIETLPDQCVQIGFTKVYFTKDGYANMKELFYKVHKFKQLQNQYRNYIKSKQHHQSQKSILDLSNITINSSKKKPKRKNQILDILNQQPFHIVNEKDMISTIKSLKEEIEKLKPFKRKNEELQIKIKRMANEMEQQPKNNDIINKQQEEINNLKEKINNLEKIISKQKKEINDLTQTLSQYKVSLTVHETKYKQLNDDKETIQIKLTNEIIENQKLKATIEQLEKEKIDSQTRNSVISNANDIPRLSNASFISCSLAKPRNNNDSSNDKKKMFHLRNDLKHCKKTIESLEGEMKNLQKQTTEYESTLTTKNNLINELQNKITLLENKLKENQTIEHRSSYILNGRASSKGNINKHNLSLEVINLKKKLFVLEEKCSKLQQDYVDMKGNAQKKKFIIQTKKKENGILVAMFKNKTLELQCMDALKYANTSNIKDKLIQIQDKEREFTAQIEKIANSQYYTDDSETEEEIYLDDNHMSDSFEFYKNGN